MKKIAYICFIVISAITLQNCEDTYAPDLDYVTFESTTTQMNVFPDETGTQEIKVYTTDISGSDRTINVNVVDASTTATGYTVSENVTIPANTNEGIITVTAPGEEIDPINGNTIVLEFSDVNTTTQYGGDITIKLVQVCPYPETILDISFDAYASESSWSVSDANGVVYSGSGYADGDATFSSTMCLSPGTYTLTFNDSYGDGLSSPAAATLSNDGNVLVTIDGNFGTTASQEFTIE